MLKTVNAALNAMARAWGQDHKIQVSSPRPGFEAKAWRRWLHHWTLLLNLFTLYRVTTKI